MPPKRKAAAASSSAAAAAARPARRRQKKAAAVEPPPAEETTEVNVYIFDGAEGWQKKLHELYTDRKLTDVVLAVGDRSVAAHRVILATVSPHLQALFSSEMVESQSRVVELQELSWEGVKAIVDFAYTGTVALSGSTVVSIIQAANLLQVEAVERAAVDFLVERLDAGNVLSAMALGAHYSAGAICRGLQEQSRAWVVKHLGQMAGEPSFLELSGAEVAGLVELDDVEATEEEVFAAVMGWVKAEEAGRKAELDRLLPLVRFPLMKGPVLAIENEPLVVDHPLAYQLLYETHPDFPKSARAASCPRLVPRKGTKPPLGLSWMCTTDAFQGFRKLTNFPMVALAVSQSNVLVEGKVYDAPAGWHWATAAEVEAVPGWTRKPGTSNYLHQGGWDAYDWEGVRRARFAFRLAQAPTADTSRSLHAGLSEGVVSAGDPRDFFAGIVCLQD